MRVPHPATLVAVLAALLVAAPAASAATAPATTHRASFTARGSIGQAYVLGAPKGAKLLLVRKGRVLATGRADRLGSRIFRALPAGGGYTVRRRTAHGVAGTRSFSVLRPGANPPAAFFQKKKLHAGLNYVTMRDGVKLAMTVRPPPGKTLADGPFPTVIEYSGYQTAAPHDLLTSITTALSGGTAKDDPLAPASSTVVGAVIARLLGFTTVSVQMRGSGCSGGAFDLFDRPTTYDGYDAVESVGAQKWVRGKVGMVGISFSGITQLFVAGTRPPHLAAIAPMSVTDDTYEGTGYPGGIFNNGFAQVVDPGADERRAAGARRRPALRAGARQGRRQAVQGQPAPAPADPERAGRCRRPTPSGRPRCSPSARPARGSRATRCRPSSSASSRTSRPAATSPSR